MIIGITSLQKLCGLGSGSEVGLGTTGGTSPGLLPRPGSALRRRTGGAWQCPRICRETGHAESAANGVLGGQEELVQGPADPGEGQPTRDKPTPAPLAQMVWGSIEVDLSCAAVSVSASPPLPPSRGGGVAHSEQEDASTLITPAPGDAEDGSMDSAIQHVYEIRLSN